MRTKIGEHEIITVSLLASLFREEWFIPDGSIVDAGAQFGEQAAYYADLAPDRTVYAIDPSPSNIAKIKETHGHLPNLKIMEAGLGQEVGVRAAPSNAGFNMADGATFRVETLDSLFYNKGERLGFAHLDLEGLELDVLKGGIKTFNTYQPVFTAEVQVHKDKKFTAALLTFIDDLGYDSYVIDEVCGYPQVDYRNLLNIPRPMSRHLSFSDAWQLALASEAIFRVTATTIATEVYPCCALGGECCPVAGKDCCTEKIVGEWLKDNKVYRPSAMLNFRGARRQTIKRWFRARGRSDKVEPGTRRQ